MTNSKFATIGGIGAGLLLAHDSASFQLGTTLAGTNGSAWIYCRTNAALAIANAGQLVMIDETFTASPIDNTNGATAFGQPVGVAPVAAAVDQYLWIQVEGVANIQVGANCAANVALASTTTAGQIDDSILTPTINLPGIVLTAARGVTDGTAPALLTRPTVGTVN